MGEIVDKMLSLKLGPRLIAQSALFIFNCSKLIQKKTHQIDTWDELQKYLIAIGKNAALEEIRVVDREGFKMPSTKVNELKEKFGCS